MFESFVLTNLTGSDVVNDKIFNKGQMKMNKIYGLYYIQFINK
jgi:hypothetical protein